MYINSRIREGRIEDSFFPVQKVRDDNKLGYALTDQYGEKLAEVSKQYRLITNEQLVKPLIDHFGIDKLVQYKRQGNKFFYMFDTGREGDFGDGDIVKHRILLWNSYDKSKSYSFAEGAFRMVCSNGLYTRFGTGFDYKKKHVGNIPVSRHVAQVLKKYNESNFEYWKALKEVTLDQDQKREIIAGFDAYNHGVDSYTSHDKKNYNIKAYADRQNSGNVDVNNQLNGWGLLNNLNWGISRVTKSTNMDENIKLNLKLEQYLNVVLLKN